MLKIANKDGYRYSESAYLIGNEFGLICVSYGYDVQDALDNAVNAGYMDCLLYTSPSPRDVEESRMPSSA